MASKLRARRLSAVQRSRMVLSAHRKAICVECGSEAKLTTGVFAGLIDPKAADKLVWACKCGAWTGCHEGTTLPRGAPGNEKTRQARRAAHKAFDPLWRGKRRIARQCAYEWLARALGIPENDCHIGLFDAAMCERVIQVCGARLGRAA